MAKLLPPVDASTLSGHHSERSASDESLSWVGVIGYLAMLVGGVGLFFLARSMGNGLEAPDTGLPPARRGSGQLDVVLHVVATLSAVILLGLVLSRLFRYIGQPPVIGEVVAGIMLGPSLLGMISPTAMEMLLPSPVQDPQGRVSSALQGISQLGVILYMFLIGLELNDSRLAARAKSLVFVSHSSIAIPFVIGALLAVAIYPVFSSKQVPFTSFALFMGAAMAITAFPVLARILSDRGMDKSDLGVMALGCAAAGDVTAWCLLALVVGVAQADLRTAAFVIGGAVTFIALMFAVGRPIVRRVVKRWDEGEMPSLAIPGTLLALLLALATEAIGIHAVFGAFLLGAIIPHDSRISRELTAKLQVPVMLVLLPAFFAFTGMRTQINLVSGWENWLWCGVITAAATIGKLGGTAIASRLTGASWRESAILGILMNTRGLMELIVLNIGLDLGIISPTLFAMMVVMALITTGLTTPLLNWMNSRAGRLEIDPAVGR